MFNQSNIRLKELIDINILQDIQDKFADITGMSFVTVDFKGKPITRYSNFSEFCKKVRSIPNMQEECYKSDAHAGLEAAISQKPYIYRCPCGLVDFAIPIIVNEQYLGALLCGQIRTDNEDLPCSVNNKRGTSKLENYNLINDYNNTIYVDYEKIESVSSLVHVVVNQIAEKSMLNLIEKELYSKDLKLIKEQKARMELEKRLKDEELKSLQSQINPSFLLNTLNSISRLAIIEDSPKTEEMIYLLSELFKYNLKKSSDEVILREDIENLDRYLKLQSMRFNDKIDYKIHLDDSVKDIKIPSMILYPLVENAITHGLMPKENNGKVEVKVRSLGDYITIRIEDDGVGISKHKLISILGDKEDSILSEEKSKIINLQNIKERLCSFYKDDYDFKIESYVGIGTSVEVKIPTNLN